MSEKWARWRIYPLWLECHGMSLKEAWLTRFRCWRNVVTDLIDATWDRWPILYYIWLVPLKRARRGYAFNDAFYALTEEQRQRIEEMFMPGGGPRLRIRMRKMP